MKIGLIRHFKVRHRMPRKILISYNEMIAWLKEYDVSDIYVKKIDLKDIVWTTCYSSDLYRAIITAKIVCKGNIISLVELRELETDLECKGNLRLPFFLWMILIRLRALRSTKYMHNFREKLRKTLEDIILQHPDENILIISHGFVMIELYKELLRRSYRGPRLIYPKNGYLYLYEK